MDLAITYRIFDFVCLMKKVLIDLKHEYRKETPKLYHTSSMFNVMTASYISTRIPRT